MQLHQLVEFKNNLQKFLDSHSFFDKTEFTDLSFNLDLIPPLNFTSEIQDIKSSIDTLFNQFELTKVNVANLIAAIDSQISELTKDYLKMGYITVNGLGVPPMSAKDERSLRDRPINHEIKEAIISTIFRSTSDNYPVLEIGPGDGIWTDFLVAGDPLYLVDRNQEFLDSTKSKYPELYQRRLRCYKLGDKDLPDSDFSMLPQGQFRFIFAWNVFNYFPLDYTKSFLTSCYKLLRPGGNMFFSFNNCEDPLCAKFAENGYASWMPLSLLKKTFLEIGFEYKVFDHRSGWHWVEIAKPGILSTVKIHQSLGEIVRY